MPAQTQQPQQSSRPTRNRQPPQKLNITSFKGQAYATYAAVLRLGEQPAPLTNSNSSYGPAKVNYTHFVNR